MLCTWQRYTHEHTARRQPSNVQTVKSYMLRGITGDEVHRHACTSAHREPGKKPNTGTALLILPQVNRRAERQRGPQYTLSLQLLHCRCHRQDQGPRHSGAERGQQQLACTVRGGMPMCIRKVRHVPEPLVKPPAEASRVQSTLQTLVDGKPQFRLCQSCSLDTASRLTRRHSAAAGSPYMASSPETQARSPRASAGVNHGLLSSTQVRSLACSALAGSQCARSCNRTAHLIQALPGAT
jgi:hypothetical protein